MAAGGAKKQIVFHRSGAKLIVINSLLRNCSVSLSVVLMPDSSPQAARSSFKNWSIGKQVLLGNILFLIVPLLLIFSTILHYTITRLDSTIQGTVKAVGTSLADMVEVSVNTSLYEHLRGIADKNLQIVESYYQKQQAGLIPESEAKKEIRALFNAQKIGLSGYLYCLSSTGVPLLHPEKEVEGKEVLSLEEYKQAWPFIREQIRLKEGYLEYSWKNPPDKGFHPKALYMRYFKPWDWIISASCYQEEFQSIIDFKAIEERIAVFRYGQSGYAFILNDKGEVLAHPDLKNKAPKPEYPAQVKAIMAAKDHANGQPVFYSWQQAEETSARDKVLFFKRIPQFGLIVAVSTTKADAYYGIRAYRHLVALVVAVGSLLAVCAAYVLSRFIATPLRSFASELAVADQTCAQVYEGGNETAFLLDQFNRYIQGIRESNEKLNAEITFRKSAEGFLQIYKTIFDNATEGIVITDISGKILSVNSAFALITGYEVHEVIGQNPRILQSGQHDAEFFQRMWQDLREKGAWEGEIWNKKKDGTIYPEWLTINSIRNERKHILYYFASFYEIGELKRREKQIAFMAYHDALTRLPNRVFLENRLAKAIKTISADGGMIAIFFIDIDNFKNVNDVFGHKQGDDLLVQVSHRFAGVLGKNDSLYRLSSDEFILLMEHVSNESVIYLMANRIQAVLKKHFMIDFKKIYVNASIGISLYPGDGDSGLELIRSADMAMHRAKREGKNRYQLFTKGMHEELYEKFRIENGIRYGLANREFVVYYQPKVTISTGMTASLEALIRWEKGGKLISPGAFIPIAEESSLIDEICLFVMEETCSFHAAMKQQQVAVPVSVNISPRQFHNADFVDIVEDLLARYQMDPQYLEFETTETTAMKDVEHTLRIMHRIRELGILFSIDDFGTGYSSLGYLHKMPVSTLKIDKQFVQDLEKNGGIVATIIAISQQMHLNVVAEGVETEEQLKALEQMGCHEAQGYYFSRPASGEQILSYLTSERTLH